MKLTPQATATYQQYLKANEMCDKLEEKEQEVVFELLNGDLRFDPSTRKVSPHGSQARTKAQWRAERMKP